MVTINSFFPRTSIFVSQKFIVPSKDPLTYEDKEAHSLYIKIQ